MPVELSLLINLWCFKIISQESRLRGPHNLLWQFQQKVAQSLQHSTIWIQALRQSKPRNWSGQLAHKFGIQSSRLGSPPQFKNRKSRCRELKRQARTATPDPEPGIHPTNWAPKTKWQLVADATLHLGPEEKWSFSPVVTWFYPCIFWLYFSSLRFSRVFPTITWLWVCLMQSSVLITCGPIFRGQTFLVTWPHQHILGAW